MAGVSQECTKSVTNAWHWQAGHPISKYPKVLHWSSSKHLQQLAASLPAGVEHQCWLWPQRDVHARTPKGTQLPQLQTLPVCLLLAKHPCWH